MRVPAIGTTEPQGPTAGIGGLLAVINPVMEKTQGGYNWGYPIVGILILFTFFELVYSSRWSYRLFCSPIT